MPPRAIDHSIRLSVFDRLLGDTETRRQESGDIATLREYVRRDLEWLLNANNAESVEDLERYPEVRRSVYNYGLPSLAGRPSSSVNIDELTEQVAEAIRFFEPRLSQVRVTPEGRVAGTDSFSLAFQVEAELWGQPLPQHRRVVSPVADP